MPPDDQEKYQHIGEQTIKKIVTPLVKTLLINTQTREQTNEEKIDNPFCEDTSFGFKLSKKNRIVPASGIGVMGAL
jgi:hypothetical protein